MHYKSIGLGLDMAGCPNRCKHCWLGATPNGRMEFSDLEAVAGAFRGYTEQLEIDSWYREPDFRDDYKALWAEERRLSDTHAEHFELASFWRLNRDAEYAAWLYKVGVCRCQLTLFGGEALTDRYVGRAGAYREILRGADVLLEHQIALRIQVFVNQEILPELPAVEQICRELEARSSQVGLPFEMFCHQGSCDGENEKHYDIWVTDADLSKIPDYIAEHTKTYFQIPELWMAFGEPEAAYCEEPARIRSRSMEPEEAPYFFVDAAFQVYPNWSTPHPWWSLGNLRRDGAAAVLENYEQQRYMAAEAAKRMSCAELAALYGAPGSRRLFGPGDYYEYLLNRHCRAVYQNR